MSDRAKYASRVGSPTFILIGFADDLAVWQSGLKLDEVGANFQVAVNIVKKWTEMNVNINKCSVTSFRKDPAEKKSIWQRGDDPRRKRMQRRRG